VSHLEMVLSWVMDFPIDLGKSSDFDNSTNTYLQSPLSKEIQWKTVGIPIPAENTITKMIKRGTHYKDNENLRPSIIGEKLECKYEMIVRV
jgi:hypothetical protein